MRQSLAFVRTIETSRDREVQKSIHIPDAEMIAEEAVKDIQKSLCMFCSCPTEFCGIFKHVKNEECKVLSAIKRHLWKLSIKEVNGNET